MQGLLFYISAGVRSPDEVIVFEWWRAPRTLADIIYTRTGSNLRICNDAEGGHLGGGRKKKTKNIPHTLWLKCRRAGRESAEFFLNKMLFERQNGQK